MSDSTASTNRLMVIFFVVTLIVFGLTTWATYISIRNRVRWAILRHERRQQDQEEVQAYDGGNRGVGRN